MNLEKTGQPSDEFAARMRLFDRQSLVLVARHAISQLPNPQLQPRVASIIQQLNQFIDGDEALRVPAFWNLIPFMSEVARDGIASIGGITTNAIWRFLLQQYDPQNSAQQPSPVFPAYTNTAPASRRRIRLPRYRGGNSDDWLDSDLVADGIAGLLSLIWKLITEW